MRFYDFCNENDIDNFLNSVKDVFVPATRGNEYKIHAYFELKKLSTYRSASFRKY